MTSTPHQHDLDRWRHTHAFTSDNSESAERRTRIVVGITVVMMLAEIIGGSLFHSMALLADGWHMSTHAGALGLAAFAYSYARRHANDERFAFGTGKVGSLAAFSSALILALIALLIVWESLSRLGGTVAINFSEALPIAVLGLVVNVASALILSGHTHHHHHHHHDDHLSHDHEDHHAHDTHHQDQTLRAAYVHIAADAVTSVLAIIALLLGKYLGWWWMDPLMGLIGAGVILNWAVGLIRDTSAVLLDRSNSGDLRQEVATAIENDADNQLADLHLWQLGPGHWAAILSVVTDVPRDPSHYKGLLHDIHELSHVTVEIHPCPGD